MMKSGPDMTVVKILTRWGWEAVVEDLTHSVEGANNIPSTLKAAFLEEEAASLVADLEVFIFNITARWECVSPRLLYQG